MALHWGIDLGGTKVEGVLLKRTPASFEVIERLRLPTEREKGYTHILGQIKKVVDQLQERSGLQPQVIGIGTPGTLDPGSRLLKNSNTVVLNGKPLKADLERIIGIPLKIANDANCFAVAETLLGVVPQQVPDAEVVFGVIMGTGVGGGLVLQGKVRNGVHGISGEWGHNFLDPSGGDCYCGLNGCVEQVISGPALERFYEEKTGQKQSLKTIVARHKNQEDPIATETMERLLYFFGKALSSVINVLDPDAVVLGGGVGNIDLLYTEGRRWVEHFSFNPTLTTPILKPSLGDSAGVFGAALLTHPPQTYPKM
jgi:fructokinase